MNREKIIAMAREAGMEQDGDNFFSPSHEEMDVHITDLERFAALVIANNPPESFMSWQEGYAQGIETATKGFCTHLRQLHDSYALSSRPGGLRARKD